MRTLRFSCLVAVGIFATALCATIPAKAFPDPTKPLARVADKGTLLMPISQSLGPCFKRCGNRSSSTAACWKECQADPRVICDDNCSLKHPNHPKERQRCELNCWQTVAPPPKIIRPRLRPKPPETQAKQAPCPPNHVLSRTGQCVPGVQCRPGHVL